MLKRPIHDWTLTYWRISSTWNGRIETGINVQTALQALANIEDNTLNMHSLKKYSMQLKEEIIRKASDK